MLRRVRSLAWKCSAKRKGAGAVDMLMILAVAAMVCLGVCQVTGVGVEGPTGGGIFSGIGQFLDKLGLGG